MNYKTEIWIRWTGVILLGLFIALIVKNLFHGSVFNDSIFSFINIIVSIFYTTFYWNTNVILMRFWRKKFPDYRQTKMRIFYTAITIFTATFLIWFCLDYLVWNVFFREFVKDYLVNYNPRFGFFAGFGSTIFIGVLYETVYFFEKWKAALLETEQLKHRQTQSELEVLKTQINPHFLFNSLNVLGVLIEEDTTKAVDFTNRLSEVYRYILQNKEKSLVTFREEWEFTQAYIFLLKSRFGENLQVKTHFSEETLQNFIPPLSLQMLVENATKHNIVSKSKPLSLEIFGEQEQIIVRNNLQVKSSLPKSTGLGLDNIQHRYQYILHQNMQIEKTENHFTVKLPLAKVEMV